MTIGEIDALDADLVDARRNIQQASDRLAAWIAGWEPDPVPLTILLPRHRWSAKRGSR